MSSYGILQAELIARQKEAERQRRVRQQCQALAEMIEQNIREVEAEPGFTTFLEGIDKIQGQVKSARSLIRESPDDAFEQLQDVAGDVHEFSVGVRSKRERWSNEREQAYREVSLLRDMVQSIPIETPAYHRDMERLIGRLDQASAVVLKSTELNTLMTEVKDEAQKIAELDEKEHTRKMIVGQVVKLLSTHGFQVGRPKIKNDVVHLQAKMPSGKEILLQIFDDAKIHFDFERYDGMACKDELDAILQKLETEGHIETCIEQFVWHNPDKIKKGAKEFPYGHSQQRYQK